MIKSSFYFKVFFYYCIKTHIALVFAEIVSEILFNKFFDLGNSIYTHKKKIC